MFDMTQEQEQVLISADSHVFESADLWARNLPARYRDTELQIDSADAKVFQAHPGGNDPSRRVKEMTEDGVSAEVLYPTLALRLFGLDNVALQQACFGVYNDWLMEYCSIAPGRLAGIALLSTYDIGYAVAELERCRAAGLRGVQVWQSPHPDLPFSSDHYEKLWSAAAANQTPVSLHILTGHDYSKNLSLDQPALNLYRGAVNLKLLSITNAMFDLIFSGVLERHPDVQFVLVENEIGWIPFVLQQWDYYYRRFRDAAKVPLTLLPSEYFERQVHATFFNDTVGGRQLAWWGADNCMWSNDYPHPNSTWPNSRAIIKRDLGHLPDEVRRKVTRDNAAQLYQLLV